jgi:hypothetical protein
MKRETRLCPGCGEHKAHGEFPPRSYWQPRAMWCNACVAAWRAVVRPVAGTGQVISPAGFRLIQDRQLTADLAFVIRQMEERARGEAG